MSNALANPRGQAKRGEFLRFDIYAPHLIDGEFVMRPLMEDDGDGPQIVSFSGHQEADAIAYVEALAESGEAEDAVVVMVLKRKYRLKGRLTNAQFDAVPLPPLARTEPQAVVEAAEAIAEVAAEALRQEAEAIVAGLIALGV